MKSKIIGLIVLLGVIAAAVLYGLVGDKKADQVSLKGYLGGEKIGLFEDEDIHKILKNKYNMTIDYSKAGSLDMVRADHSQVDYLFPSSQTALDLYEKTYGKPVKSQIIFNTPIVLYSRKIVVEKLISAGIASKDGDVYYVDMPTLISEIEKGTTWADIGLPELYGTLAVNTTDPNKSNSGNMFAGLVANIINGGKVVDSAAIADVLPKVQNIFRRLGYMETSSADLFDQFLKVGVGAKPLVAGYENQILEFAVAHSQDWQGLKEDIIILYPTPTVWSSHIYISLNEKGNRGIDALMNSEVQELAWKKHGFRTGVASSNTDTTIFGVNGILPNVTRIIPMPGAAIMEQITSNLN